MPIPLVCKKLRLNLYLEQSLGIIFDYYGGNTCSVWSSSWIMDATLFEIDNKHIGQLQIHLQITKSISQDLFSITI